MVSVTEGTNYENSLTNEKKHYMYVHVIVILMQLK